MSLLDRIKPKFWDYHDSGMFASRQFLNFRTIWKEAVIVTSFVSLVPLIFLALVDYNVTRRSAESEVLLRTSRLVSNTRRTVYFFLEERKLTLDFINRDNSFDALNDSERLKDILSNLNKSMAGFIDIGLIDSFGNQRSYYGPFDLENKNYSDQEWFHNVMAQGFHISDVFLGHRNLPHFVIAVKHKNEYGDTYVLRVTVDMARFNDLILGLEISEGGDAFIINHDGVLQTNSRRHCKLLEKCLIPIPKYSEKTEVHIHQDPMNQKRMVIGYAYIHDTPFILMVSKNFDELIRPWHRTRFQLITFLSISILIIVFVIFGISTYLVNHIYMADQKRISALHEVEYNNKMASIGRLAAGVAHEVNNPLAIINEKAGLIKDLFTFKAQYAKDERLIKTVDSIISSVERCGTITKRLLSFARHMDADVKSLNPADVIREVLSFLTKEAEYRCIHVEIDVEKDIPPIESDRGKLQQIFLNLMNNAFAAMPECGQLRISVKKRGKDAIRIDVEDNGCGINEEDLKRIFEPFFTTKSKTGGTGLGLSITYNLVYEIGGLIEVKSEVGKGTTFTITLPHKIDKTKRVNHD